MIVDKWTWGALFVVLIIQGYRFYRLSWLPKNAKKEQI